MERSPSSIKKCSARKEKGGKNKKGWAGGWGGKDIANSKYGPSKTPKALTHKASALSIEKLYFYYYSIDKQLSFTSDLFCFRSKK